MRAKLRQATRAAGMLALLIVPAMLRSASGAPLPQSAVPAPSVAATGVTPNEPTFTAVTGPIPLRFPVDHGPHPEFRQEWWYFTGNLDGPHGERFGFELTFFRVALVPRPVSTGWRAQQYYFAHFAVTDAGQKRFHVAERAARDALGLAGAQGDPLHVWVRDWSVQQTSERPRPSWRLAAADGDTAIQLSLVPGTPVLNGEQGFSRKSDEPGSASIYYSIPRLPVSGTLVRGGETLAVKGLAWLDREWGSGALGAHQSGWDWFALQLDDGSALMYYRLRGRDGRTDPHSAGTLTEPTGATVPLAASAVGIETRASWDSPRGGRYPARWRLRLPARKLDVEITPILADQELAVSPRYWEGAVDVRGTRDGRAIAGRGYVELVGYARPPR